MSTIVDTAKQLFPDLPDLDDDDAERLAALEDSIFDADATNDIDVFVQCIVAYHAEMRHVGHDTAMAALRAGLCFLAKDRLDELRRYLPNNYLEDFTAETQPDADAIMDAIRAAG